jgi:phage recombination protein Bet
MEKKKKPEVVRHPKPAKAEPIPKPEEDTKEIKVIERIIESKEIAPADTFGKLNRQQIDLIKRTVAKGATDDELKMFLQVCKGAQLNPFLKQVFLVPRWDSREGKEVRAIQVSIDGFRSIAESSGAYAGNEDPIFDGESTIKVGTPAKDLTVPNKATVTVYKVVEGQRYPFTATARWQEYYPGVKMGFQWHIRPFLMLGKCAEALALRKAFPKLLSGMYEEAELANTQEQKPPQIPNANPDKVFISLKGMIEKATLVDLQSYRDKLKTPGKKVYTEAQKIELLKMVDARIAELDKIPTINVDES